MASFVYNRAVSRILNGSIDLDTNTLKVMLVNSTYTPDRDHDFVDAGGSSDPVDAEVTVTNYTRGWGGSGRKTVTVTITEQDASDRAVAIFGDLTWTSLGGAANQTVVGAILIKEGGSDDTTSELIVYWDLADTTTDGSNFVLTMDATNGNLRASTV